MKSVTRSRVAGIRRIHPSRTRALALRLALLTASVAAVPGVALAADSQAAAKSQCPTTSAALLKRNATNQQMARQLMHSTKYTPIVRTFTPKATSSAGFNGYQTLTVKSPQGTSPVVGYFKLSGAQRCSVVVTSAAIALKQNVYVLRLKFPGEQGNPGGLTVGLVSR
jgi:hypothetical protein